MTTNEEINGKKGREILFEVGLNWLDTKRGIISAHDVQDTLRVSLPQAFGGQGNEWSPEHLFLGSIASCYMTTLLVFADKFRVQLSRHECQAIGEIEMVNGKYEFTVVNLYPKVFIANEADREKAVQAMQKTQKYCLISNSVKCGIIYHGSVELDRHPLHKEVADRA